MKTARLIAFVKRASDGRDTASDVATAYVEQRKALAFARRVDAGDIPEGVRFGITPRRDAYLEGELPSLPECVPAAV